MLPEQLPFTRPPFGVGGFQQRRCANTATVWVRVVRSSLGLPSRTL
jgi:hypothetical protein